MEKIISSYLEYITYKTYKPEQLGFYIFTIAEVIRVSSRPWWSDFLYKGNYNPSLDAVLGHGGDVMNGYQIAFASNWFLAHININEKIKLGMSFLAGTAAVIIAETVQTPGSILGTPDLADIPAGVLGVAASVGLHLLGKWNYQRAHPELRNQALSTDMALAVQFT